jgi:hypothetical protein
MRNAEQIVEQEFLQMRAKILEIAAFFDRLEADSTKQAGAATSSVSQERLKLLRAGCDLLLDSESDKAARVQLLLSRKFDEQWRQTMDV